MSRIGNNSAGASGPYSDFPKAPKPVKDHGWVSDLGSTIPHNGTLVDNIVLPIGYGSGATGDFDGRLGTSTVWTVACTDINAGTQGFLASGAAHYDSVNDRLYVWAVEAGAPDTWHMAYITVETGAVTNIASTTITTDPTSVTSYGKCAVIRTAIDSGNFTLKFEDRDIVFHETTGAEVSNDAATNVTEAGIIGNYSTLDGTIQCYQIATGANPMVSLTKNGHTVLVGMVSFTFGGTDSGIVYPVSWGDHVKFSANNTTANRNLIRTVLRSEFDTYLGLVCDRGGLA